MLAAEQLEAVLCQEQHMFILMRGYTQHSFVNKLLVSGGEGQTLRLVSCKVSSTAEMKWEVDKTALPYRTSIAPSSTNIRGS